MKGKVKLQVYDTIDFNACKTDSDFDLIKTTQKPMIAKSELVVPNGIVTAWKNNIASALCDSTWGWSTPAAQVCFEANNSTQMCCVNQALGGDFFDTVVSSYAKTCIEIRNNTDENTIMYTGNAVYDSTNTLNTYAYMTYCSGVFTSATIGLLNSFVRAGDGTSTWYEQMATATFSVTVGATEVLKLTWTITITG